MRVLMFGPLRETAGWSERRFEPPPASLAELFERLETEDPALTAALRAPGVQVAIDQAISRAPRSLEGAREVAFLPPMSGG